MLLSSDKTSWHKQNKRKEKRKSLNKAQKIQVAEKLVDAERQPRVQVTNDMDRARMLMALAVDKKS
jgi:hypothetical protein